MRKTIAAEMRKYLDARLPDGRTRREALVASILGKAFEAGRMADLKLLVEILGEEVKRIDVHAVGRFVVDDADERDLYEAIADLDNYD